MGGSNTELSNLRRRNAPTKRAALHRVGVIDLKEATACHKVSNPDYNYEFAFEVTAPMRTWVHCCPGDQADQFSLWWTP